MKLFENETRMSWGSPQEVLDCVRPGVCPGVCQRGVKPWLDIDLIMAGLVMVYIGWLNVGLILAGLILA